MNDPFEPRLARLLRQERSRSDPAPLTKARVLARVQMTVGIPAPPDAASNTPPALGSGSFVPAIVLSVVAAGLIATGTVGWLLTPHSTSPTMPRVYSAPRGAAIALESAESALAPVSHANDAPPTPVASADPSSAGAPALVADLPRAHPGSIAASPSSGVNDLATERLLLDRARACLLHGEPADALTSTATHARRFPHGVLSEERDALRVEALVSARRYEDARSAASRFHGAYPDSVLTAAVDAALDEIP